MPKIREVIELRTDEMDLVRDAFTIVVVYDDNTTGELEFTKNGGRMMRDLFDCIPELDEGDRS